MLAAITVGGKILTGKKIPVKIQTRYILAKRVNTWIPVKKIKMKKTYLQ